MFFYKAKGLEKVVLLLCDLDPQLPKPFIGGRTFVQENNIKLTNNIPHTFTEFYIQEAGRFYDTPEEAAALILETTSWSDQQWCDAFNRSVDRAYSNFVSTSVLKSMIID
jgi:hypothetical protein